MSYQYRREPLTDDEMLRLANACESYDEKLIVHVLLDTGLRVSELAGIKPHDIDFQRHRLTVYGKGGPYGNNSKRRVVPLPARARALLENHFTLHEKMPVERRQIQRIVRDVAGRARISRTVTPHVLRHTYACLCLKKKIGLVSLQRLLGHEHLSTTQIYTNLAPEDVVRDFEENW